MQGTNSVQRKSVIVSGALMVLGYVVLIVANRFHPNGIDPNNHTASFTQYSHWPGWTPDHLLFFVSFFISIAALLVLIEALDVHGEIVRLVVRLATVSAIVAIALSAVRMFIDGVVLERAVNAWAAAPASEAAARFANAETVRWMEEASGSYQNYMIGLSMVVLGGLILWTGRVSRPIGVLIAIAGAGNLAVGWILGEAGFAAEGAIPSYASQVIPVFAGVYLVVFAWRMSRRQARAIPSGAVAVAE